MAVLDNVEENVNNVENVNVEETAEVSLENAHIKIVRQAFR